jgi:hypothetical protein
MNTPWGRADNPIEGARGIALVSTPGHGGFRLSDERQAALPEPFRSFVPFAGPGWYEEDCDWCIVVLAFPEEFADPQAWGFGQDAGKFLSSAERTLRDWFPDLWEEWTGRKLGPGESHKRIEEEWHTEHAEDWIGVSARGDWADDVPKGFVRVTAILGGHNGDDERGRPERRFLVPTEEYARRDRWGFVIDLERHTELTPATQQPLRRNATGGV